MDTRRLNPDYVLSLLPFMLGACQNNVLLGLRIIESIEEFPKPTKEENLLMNIYFNGHITDVQHSKSLFRQWILKSGFEAVHNYLRATFERLFTYKELERELVVNPSTNAIELENSLRTKANKLNFPDLLEKVNQSFDHPIILQDYIESINNARNCFVHRNGIVGPKDINNMASGKLEIIGKKFRLFFRNSEGETPAVIGTPGPIGAGLYLGEEAYKIEFGLGEEIVISLSQFVDILNTCVFFDADIQTKLKQIKT